MDKSCMRGSIISNADADDAIQYVSQETHNFVQDPGKVTVGMSHGSFLKGLKVDPEDVELSIVAETLHLDADKVTKRLRHLTSYTLAEHRAVVQGTVPAKVGVALQIINGASGQLQTCKLIMTTIERPDNNVCCLTLLHDVTSEIGVEYLMSVASTGDYFELMRGQKALARSKDFVEHLHEFGQSASQALFEASTNQQQLPSVPDDQVQPRTVDPPAPDS